jgi:hypothetical protein
MPEPDFESATRARHVDASNSQGWGAAALIVVVTAALWVIAGQIHARTFHPPTDPTVRTSAALPTR